MLAEFIGTFALIFVGVGAIAADWVVRQGAGSPNLVGIALAHGLTLSVMISALGAISGGQFNPAVSLGLLVGGKLNPKAAAGCVIAQCLGAIVAAATIKMILPSEVLLQINMGTPGLGEGISIPAGILLEAILTFFLITVVIGTAVDARAPKVGGLFIGLTVALDILIGGPFTGAAMNPARHLGPALMGGGLSQSAIYWAGPLIGGAFAGALYRFAFDEKK